jgi:hypothetical protein
MGLEAIQATVKKRKPKPLAKPKVSNSFKLLKVMLTTRRLKSLLSTSFKLIHQLAQQDKKNILTLMLTPS